MKEIVFGPEPLGDIPLDAAFDTIFGKPMLRIMHGSDMYSSDWDKHGKRVIKFSVPIDSVPREIRHFSCGNRLRVTTKQQRTSASASASDQQEETITVKNNVRLHFLGAEFFKVKPSFKLMRDTQAKMTYVSGRVEHHAILPPPLNGIAEGFMALNSARELAAYREAICNALTID